MRMFDNIVEHYLNEGLITSYNINKLQNYLFKKYNDNIYINNPSKEELKEHNYEYRAYSFILNLITNINVDDFRNKLKKDLNLFGYYINKHIKQKDYITYQIEPRYPIQINDVLKNDKIKYLYHISPTSNLKRIQKIGLAPRGTETDFYHPDDRIYLVNTSHDKLHDLLINLAKNKHLNSKDFTVFKIPYSDKYKYYLDDMATFKTYNMIAVFVLQNIPPNELKIIDIVV